MMHSKRKSGQRGTALIVGTCSMILVVPMIGLAVDVGLIYALKAQLQASVDGASLAAARALSLSANTASQVSDAQHNANNWFYSNFPNSYWGATSSDMAPDDTHVHVYDDAANPHLRHVDVTASIDAPNYFMRWFGAASTHIVAKGYASRRDVVAMLVLDRSGSMGGSCSGLVDAAKLFTGQFSVGRDKIGAISFADNAYLHSVPTTNFRTALGFDTSVGATGSNTGTGELDDISTRCAGGTNTASAIALAYNEIYKNAEPGALNVIVFETDGHPNTVTVNFAESANWGVSGTAAKVALASGSTCTDASSPAKTLSAGGFSTVAKIPYWQGSASTPAYTLTTLATGQTAAPYYSATQTGPAFYTSDIRGGMVGALGGYDSGNSIAVLFKSWTTSNANKYNESGSASNTYVTASGCAFNASQNTASDFSYIPTTDVYGNNLDTSYYSVTTATLNGATRISPVTMSQMRSAAFNAVDDAAHRFRTNGTIPVTFYAVGFNSADTTLMQRVANDPGWIGNASCTSDCQYDSSQPTGKYVYASSTAALNGAFQALASQILRLAQ